MRGSPISSTLCLLAVASAVLSSAADTQKIEQKPAVPGEKYNYAQVLYLSILFYEAQRSGKLPANNRIPWREDSALHDGKDVDRDLTGGWYDAGDFVKFGFPMAFSATTLAWGLLEYWDAYVKSGELQHMLDCIKWPLDFLVKAHAPDKQLFFVQIGDGVVEHEYWGPPETEMTDRPSYDVSPQAVGSEPTAEAAAAMAAGYLVFKDEDAVYADVLLHHSRILFDFAYTNQGSFNISEPFYKSWTGYKDELAWAALWLYKATGEAAYLAKATAIYTDCCSQNTPQAFGWDNKGPAVRLLLYKLTRQQKYADDFNRYMDTWLALPKTPKGLAFYLEWGPLRYSANTAFLALVAADYGIKPDKFRAFAVSQIHYILGDCCGGVDPKTKQPLYSYVIGYGNNYPHAPHHRAASCQGQECDCSTSPHPHTLYGAMVGGPDRQDHYLDDCQNYMQAEVATDYNAGLQGAVAALKHLSITKQLPPSP